MGMFRSSDMLRNRSFTPQKQIAPICDSAGPPNMAAPTEAETVCRLRVRAANRSASKSAGQPAMNSIFIWYVDTHPPHRHRPRKRQAPYTIKIEFVTKSPASQAE
jgi:hypothetical protein